MTKLLICSDNGVPTGYGRIADEVGVRLHQRGYNIMAASYAYDGKLPAMYEGAPLPYWVATMAGKPNYAVEDIIQLIAVYQPDIVMVIQDFPYIEALRLAPVDWSKYAFMAITPVDGTPIYPRWVDMAHKADGMLTISEFGVKAFAEAGVQVGLCKPGVNLNKFFPLPKDQTVALRNKAGIPENAFILGTMCMNQGRKAIDSMLTGFFRFASDKSEARYVLDMDSVSMAGWDIPAICQQQGWNADKLIFRDALQRAGLIELRERYALLDAHAVLAHREGYGLPLAEAQACGVVSMALDYCSGTEIVGDGKGCLIQPLKVGDKPYTLVSTWGGALDYMVDVDDFTKQLQFIYDHPAERQAMAERGMQTARSWTWDQAADNVQARIEKVLAARHPTTIIPAPAPLPAPVMSPDGMKQEELAKA